MKVKFIPIDYDYFDCEGRNWVRIVGRMENGKKALIVDSCDAYFWVILKDGLSDKKVDKVCERIEKISVEGKVRIGKVIRTEIASKRFLGKDVRAVKVYVNNYKDAHDIASQIDYDEVYKRREYDLSFVSRYIIDKGVKPLVWCDVEGEMISGDDFGGIGRVDVDVCLKAEKMEESKKQIEFKPRILAYDIETDEFEIGKGEIVMISLVGEDCKKVLTWKNGNKNYIKNYSDEGEMLGGFVEEVKKYDPDILIGYFSDGFDLPYLRARAEKNKLKLNLGVDDSQPVFSRGRMMSGKIKGIVHVDLFRFIRTAYSQYLQSESLSLNDVANELLGEKKVEWKHKHSSKIKKDEWNQYFEYNLKDSEITYRLMEKLLPDLLEFTRIIQEPLFNISRDSISAQVENYIIHHINEYDEIIEKRPYNNEIGVRRAEEKYEGAFVFQPVPGLYDHVVFFDFTSMYGSVIVSFNLSKSTLVEKEKNSFGIDIGKKVYFSKKPGFFSDMIGEMITKRKQVKGEYNKNPDPILRARSNAFKLLVNAAYGYQGFFGARYYCREAAASTAAFARKEIKNVIDMIEKKGYKVVYGDTDSICFERDNRSKKEVLNLLKEINEKLPGIMELDLEGFFKRGIWVSRRNGDVGAKKKYALIGEDGRVKIRGFETVRRDWCGLAREMQNKVLGLVLNEGNEKKAVDYVRGIINKLKKREIEIDKLIIKTQLKRPVEDYKSINPHVSVAKKMIEKGMLVNVGMLIEYYIAGDDKKRSLVRDRARMVDDSKEGNADYDVQYYLRNQILPAVENIFEIFNVDVNSLLDGERQKGLGEFS